MIIEYLLFIGSAFYLISGVMFFYLFFRTIKASDGLGLVFLRFLTFSLSMGSFTIFMTRILSEYGNLDYVTARAIAVVNPILLVVVALYLNYLFHNNNIITKSQDSKSIQKTEANVKEIKSDVKDIKRKVV
jgi:hypothetical protein